MFKSKTCRVTSLHQTSHGLAPSYRNASRRTIHAAPADSSSGPGLTDPIAYCREVVRKHDYESFLISQCYPRHLRGGYFALKAFSVNLAMVQDEVSNPTIGKMQMQFWRDGVGSIAGDRPLRHPIVLALHKTSQITHLPTYHLKRIVDARDQELYSPTHLTVDSLMSHAESTSSTLFYLLLSLLSLTSSTLSHAASHLGIAQTIATLIRGIPFHASKRRMVIPAEITSKHRVRHEDVFRTGGAAGGISDAVFEFATIANDHILTAKEMFEGSKDLKTSALPIFLAGVPIKSFLGRLEAVDFDAFHPSLQISDWRLPWQIWRNFYQGSF